MQHVNEPCRDCQQNYVWIQIPYEYGWRWVTVTAWMQEPTNHDWDEERRRRGSWDEIATPEAIIIPEEEWEEWRDDEEPLLEEDDDPPPAYSP